MAADEEAAELLGIAPDDATLDAFVARRTSGEPLAWITGTSRFCDLDILVHSGVYVPRWQSEPVARRAAELLPAAGAAVDLCTGSGAIAMVLRHARPRAEVVATEVDPVASACARRNGVDVREGRLFDPLPEALAGAVDVMVGVLPYVPAGALHLLPRDVVEFEPRLALDGGPDGLDVVGQAVDGSGRWVRPGGWLLLEVGGDQIDVTRARFATAGYDTISVMADGDGDPRAVVGRRAV